MLNEIENLTTVLENLNTLFIFKTRESIFTHTNDATARLAGYKTAEELIGKTDYDVKCDAQKYADLFRAQDREAFNLGMLNTIDIMKYCDAGLKILFTSRKTFQTQNGLTHLCSTAIELPPMILGEVYKNNFIFGKTGSFQIINEIKKEEIHLSRRETQCIFFLLRGRSAKETASILNLSYKTVEDHIEKIKCKLNCSKKSELFDKAFHLGIHQYIPQDICYLSGILPSF
ncbi:MAG: hypothetical protein HYX60_11595 [Legionella longbeachae]|nr:hypothetical protein [Legionella longbeachae]